MSREHWSESAACRGKKGSVFFPDHRTLNEHRYDEALAICANCSVRQDCLDMVIVLEDTDDRWGVFGGMTPPQRAKLRGELKEMVK